MSLENRIETFSALGKILRDSLEGIETGYTSDLERLIENQQFKNPWFIPENVRMAICAIARELTTESLTKWTSLYPLLKKEAKPYKVAVIMAGNIPLVGFHDFLSVLITGNDIVVKASSKDPDLIKFISRILTDINPEFSKKISFVDGVMSGFEAVIATGSNNTSRYFESYFGKYYNIIRKNRNSIAILEGNESGKEIEDLGTDIFSYFGLGCRNVSKIYVPRGFDFTMLTERWGKFETLVNHTKYANNYDYYKAVFMVNREPFSDTGYLLIKESPVLSSPVAVLNFEYYESGEEINRKTENIKDMIQCFVGRNHLSFGSAQSPALWDYADGTDTIEFILKKNSSGIL